MRYDPNRMLTPWETLCEAGVPDGAVRPASTTTLDADAVSGALRAVVSDASALTSPQRECLARGLAAALA
jgi:hypothetical protein